MASEISKSVQIPELPAFGILYLSFGFLNIISQREISILPDFPGDETEKFLHLYSLQNLRILIYIYINWTNLIFSLSILLSQ